MSSNASPKVHFDQPDVDVVVHDDIHEVLEGDPYDTSLLSLYANNVVRHICDAKYCDVLKRINHGRKIAKLQESEKQ
ncbi:hypothetical protein KIW84_032511 [Lathyrus oleraceus]|uniref:Uncharacterized protein n=1 Tax=Pisum sativum TaxID=3888 RepID=A0A9D5AYT1_PEA|nr:hypothetical protein KIW84_032511 [Pisum sativum]